ncbi:protein GAPT isoform X2 [Sagmatias obliquidens]|uniref:protein GAPT isoform X2 n=1 Tax=Sagmatias obliquidens TaxID=3371155 RepID=UPI000F43E7D1|nr:protein GAPT isoform X2 [Lagenorhynchus obliquidens]
MTEDGEQRRHLVECPRSAVSPSGQRLMTIWAFFDIQGPKHLKSCELEDLKRQKRTRKSQGQGGEPEETAEETPVQEKRKQS